MILDSFSEPLLNEIDPDIPNDLDQVNSEFEVPLLETEIVSNTVTAENLLPNEISLPVLSQIFAYQCEMEFIIDSQNECIFKTRQDLI